MRLGDGHGDRPMSALGDKAVELAQNLIRCESVTPADAGALDVLISALKPARATFWRLNFKDEGTPPVDNLYARIGDGPPNLCFAGHVDVVPSGDFALWSHAPFAAEIDDGRLYGRGASDMKGAIACFTAAALDYVKSRGREIDGSISLLITGDEEGPAINGTRKVLAWMKEQGEQPDHCLVGEPTNAKRIGDAIKIGRRGSSERNPEGDRRAGPCGLSPSCQQSGQRIGKGPRPLSRHAARLRHRAFLAVKSRSDQHRCRQSHHQRDSAGGRGALQCALQRPAHGGIAGRAAPRAGDARAVRHRSHHEPRVRAAERLLSHRAGPARCVAERGGERGHRSPRRRSRPTGEPRMPASSRTIARSSNSGC